MRSAGFFFWPLSGGCCGQGKTDTQFSNPRQVLIFMGTDIPERRVLPSAVGAHLDVSDHIVARLLTRGVIMVRRPRTCSTANESLGHRIVEPLARTTQTTADSMVCQQVLIRVTGLLTAAIRIMQQTCCGMTTSPRHPQRVRSCASRLRIIPVTLKPGKMPPFHHRQRGHGHDTDPIFLRIPVGRPGVDLPHALLAGATSPRRPFPGSPHPPVTPAHALARAQTVCGSQPQATLHPVRARSGVSHITLSRATDPDAVAPPTSP